MKREFRSVVIDYAAKLSDRDLRFLLQRLIERTGEDLAEAIELLSESPKVDEVLVTAVSATELYDFLDAVQDLVIKEGKKRDLVLYTETEEDKEIFQHHAAFWRA